MVTPVQTTLKYHHSPLIPTVMPPQDAGVVMDMYSYAMKTVQYIPDEKERGLRTIHTRHLLCLHTRLE